ncbi:MAG: type IV pilin protein [Noviherbaspirillum sp.]
MRLKNDLKRFANLHRGFTLLEVLVAVAIVGILAAIAYPSYTESVRKAKRTEGRSALLQLMQQLERFYSQRNTYIKFTSSSTSEDEKKFKWFSGDNPASSAYEISADACAGDTIRNCVLLTAKPGTSKVDAAFKDPVCGELTLTSTGVKSAAGPDCWK